uniref:Uncharacterized protein n=1 Tax=Tanacetum cinerariifolium TaxID=118510 RepID=A0A6L2MWQ8_TANCI|nr:hypothetical protein [Tanacetum cinerariifolium]
MASFDYRLNPLYPIKECSSCGVLYTTDYCCSEGSLGDKIICDLDKTPDLSQRSPQNCPKCGNPVDGHYCQGCALLRKKFKEDLFTYGIENGILQDSSKPSNDNTNVGNALQEPFIVNQDPGKKSSQTPLQINYHCCYGCGEPLEDIFCHQCTCELCGKGAHYGYNCLSKVLIVPDPKPFNNQTDDELPPTVLSFDPNATLELGIHSLMIPTLILFMMLLTFLTHLCNLLCILVNFARMMLVMVTIVHLKFRLSIRNRVTIKTLISRKIFMIFNNNIFVVKMARLLMKLTNEPDNSLSMGEEHLDTIPTTKSDELIKSSVENLVPNPSKSEGEYISKKTYSNPLFDEEIISMKIDPHHFNAESDLIESLLNHDSLIIFSSSKIDSLFDEFAGELTLLKSILPGINETDCDPKEETHFIKRLFIPGNLKTHAEGFCPPVFISSASLGNHVSKSNRANVYLMTYLINSLRFT